MREKKSQREPGTRGLPSQGDDAASHSSPPLIKLVTWKTSGLPSRQEIALPDRIIRRVGLGPNSKVSWLQLAPATAHHGKAVTLTSEPEGQLEHFQPSHDGCSEVSARKAICISSGTVGWMHQRGSGWDGHDSWPCSDHCHESHGLIRAHPLDTNKHERWEIGGGTS